MRGIYSLRDEKREKSAQFLRNSEETYDFRKIEALIDFEVFMIDPLHFFLN